MIGAVHDELRPAGDRAEFPDDQLVADKRVVVEDVALEVLRVLWIVVLRVVADDDVGVGHRVLDEAHLRKTIHRVFICRARSVHRSPWNLTFKVTGAPPAFWRSIRVDRRVGRLRGHGLRT